MEAIQEEIRQLKQQMQRDAISATYIHYVSDYEGKEIAIRTLIQDFDERQRAVWRLKAELRWFQEKKKAEALLNKIGDDTVSESEIDGIRSFLNYEYPCVKKKELIRTSNCESGRG